MFLFSPSHRSTVRLSRTMHHVVPVVPDRPTRVAPEAKQNQSCTHSTVHRTLAYRSYQLSTQLDRDAACSTISIQMAKRQTTQWTGGGGGWPFIFAHCQLPPSSPVPSDLPLAKRVPKKLEQEIVISFFMIIIDDVMITAYNSWRLSGITDTASVSEKKKQEDENEEQDERFQRTTQQGSCRPVTGCERSTVRILPPLRHISDISGPCSFFFTRSVHSLVNWCRSARFVCFWSVLHSRSGERKLDNNISFQLESIALGVFSRFRSSSPSLSLWSISLATNWTGKIDIVSIDSIFFFLPFSYKI